ncbi:hypothetical protein KKD20_04120 [Patescibacteria group bacterium]|nr:hypothetical protein [Patescibacteria group bacterium]
MSKKISLLTITIFLLTTTIAQAVGVSAVPSKLKVDAAANEISSAHLTIKNPSNKVSIYDVYADDYQTWIKIQPMSFTLEAGEIKKVTLSIKPPQAGVFSTNISVVAKPLSTREFQANSGIKIPIQISVLENRQKKNWLTMTNALYVIDILLGFILLMTFVTRRRRSKGMTSRA